MSIKIDDFKKQLDDFAAHNKDKVTVTVKEDTSTYNVNVTDATLVVRISPRWIGYELSIKKRAFGREFGETVDTDNYPLDGKNSEITKNIFEETRECFAGLLDGKVYAGMIGPDPILAIPLPNRKYRLKHFRTKKKWWHLLDSSASANVSLSEVHENKNLRALN